MKKLVSILLSIAMIFSFASISVFAEETTEGTITISGASTSSKYEIYKILDLKSFDTTSGRYSYKTNDDWADFFETEAALKYVTVDADGYVNWTNTDATQQQLEAPDFAKAALAWAKEKGKTPVKSTSNSDDYTVTDTSIVFSELELGYYLVDSTVGALCGLTTTNNNASITAKNNPPTLTKFVKEDSTDKWVTINSADIGQVIEYWVEIKVHSGAQNYVLHDIMSNGIKYNGNVTVELDGVTVDESNYTVNTGSNDYTFEVVFTEEFCNALKTGSKINVYYEGVLDTDAVIAGNGNSNEAWVTYGEGGATEKSFTYTKTYAFDIVKTDSQNILIDGAKFKLYKSKTGTDEIKLVKVSDGQYRVATAEEIAVAEVEIVTAEQATETLHKGTARITGLDNDTYYLEETVAPIGYNKLTTRRSIIIADANHDAVFTNGNYASGSGIQIVNQAGAMLPETGGTGTMMFILFGSIVVLGTGVLLVTKKRMSMIED